MDYNNYWFNQFFKTEITQEYQDTIFDILKKEDKDFKQNPHYTCCPIKQISPKRHEALNNWYLGIGQEVLINMFNDLWEILYQLSEHAMPAHDARHALFKVPLSSIEYIHSENINDWQKIGVFG